MQKIEEAFFILLIIAMIGCVGMFGYTLSERNQCIKLGGNYSLDFGKCYKKGELLNE